MTYFHQLWEPPISPATISIAQKEIQRAQQIGDGSERERQFIHAASLIYQDACHRSVPHARVELRGRDERSRCEEHERCRGAGVLRARAAGERISADKTHAKQKQAAALLEPLDRSYPEHPGIPHYLIHAYDNAELAPKGLPAAKSLLADCTLSAACVAHAIAHIHATRPMGRLHRLEPCGKAAAHQQGDTGEELHAMDYLVYAYLQSGRDNEAAQVIQQLKNMPKLNVWRFQDCVRLYRDADSLRG